MSRNAMNGSCAVLLGLWLGMNCFAQTTTVTSPAEELAARIAAAKTEAERAALLEEKKELLTPQLVQAFIKQFTPVITQGSPAQALSLFEWTRGVAERIGDKPGLAMTIFRLGQINNFQDELEKAAGLFRESLALYESLGDTASKGMVLSQLGVLQSKQANFDQAVQYYQESLRLLEVAGRRAESIAVLINISSTYSDQGNLEAALQFQHRALSQADELQLKREMGIALTNIGTILTRQGNYSLALESLRQSLVIKEETKNVLGVAFSLINIGELYRLQGNNELAFDYFQKSQQRFQEAKNKRGIAQSVLNGGLMQLAASQPAAALASFQEALKLYDEVKDKVGSAECLSAIGLAYTAQGDTRQAREYFQQSLTVSIAANSKLKMAEALNNLATVHLSENEAEQALKAAQQAVAITQGTGSLESLWQAHTLNGKAFRALNQPAQAEQAFAAAAAVIEDVRAQAAGSGKEQQSFFEGRVSPYYELVELLIGQQRLPEAFAYAERAKGRVLLDVLGSSRTNVTKSLTNDEQARERRLNNALTSLNSQLARELQREKPDAGRVKPLEARQGQARREYEDFENQIYAAHPELRLQRGEARTINLTQASLLLPDARSALLEYVVTDDRAYLFVLTKAGANVDLKAYPLAVKRKELAKKVEGFRRALAERDLEFSKPARALYDLLLAPARAQLRNKTSLVIVPDGALWELPFQALQSAPNRFLLEQSALSYAPSLSVLHEIEAQRRKRAEEKKTGASLLAFGNPSLGKLTVAHAQTFLRSGATLDPLPEAENEVKALAQLYGARHSHVYTGAEAREARVKEEAEQFSVVHFATHGVFNDASPMYSHLMLAEGGDGEDGLLEAWEIMKLNLHADLVVLSACETARGRVGAGEGLIGLSWAMFVAGSPTTVVSQWKVASGATRQLMIEFHRRLKTGLPTPRAGGAKAEALRAASLRMMRSGEFRHPFYWASFVVIGTDK